VRLVLTGGGTGGHIYPALAIAGELRRRGRTEAVLFVGGRGGMEERIVPEAGLPLVTLPVSGLVRKRPPEVAAALLRLGAALGAALGVLRRFRPDVVVGTGGYAAGPVGLAAVLLGVPLVLQEQNAVPGVTNRWLAPFAACIAVPYPDAAARLPRGARVLVAGNPVRPEVVAVGAGAVPPAEARRRLGLSPAARVVLVVAGSRGSAVFVSLVAGMLAELREGVVLFVSGRDHFAAAVRAAEVAVRGAATAAEGPPGAVRVGRAVIVPYLSAMADGWAAADVAVCRAGAITLAELAAAARPAVLVPSPHVTHRHQEANAEVFRRAGAAVVLPERGLDGRQLAGVVAGLLADPERRARMAAAARGLAQPDALARIADAVEAAARAGRRAAGRG
jgi:UDP-N-acetylglucosamine--N-acetylmuramyl-(pentapeptide) pyrophosphoryl-undecaprenol N-acetylglucosamine transferase